MKSFEVKSLFIYPVKSLAGIQLHEAEVCLEGFRNDRRWMLVDADGTFISQRSFPELALFNCALKKDLMEIRYGSESISFPLIPGEGSYRNVSVWGTHFMGQNINQEVSEWFSDLLNNPVSLVYMGKDSNRIKTFDKAPYNSRVSFADGYPYLLVGTASLDHLNSRLNGSISMNRFRPNIVVNTSEPHEEDNWYGFRTEDVYFKNIKPCARCIMTTIDQETASKGKEPLNTLSKYRKEANKIYFGTNLIALNKGVVRQGDLITISTE